MLKYLKKTILILVILAMLCPSLCFARAAGYDPHSEGILSSCYHIDREKGFILGITPGTTAEYLLSVCLPGDCVLSQETLATGTTLATENCIMTLIVTGDLNGDAAVTITDLLMLKSAILGETLSETAAAAADVNYDGSITITDFLQVKSTLLGLSEISAGVPQGASPPEPAILLSPGVSQSWRGGDDAAAYTSDNPDIAAIHTDGTVTGTAAGSTHVYALDANGNILSRMMVSVLSVPLTISLDSPPSTISPGEAVTLSPRFSHPVIPSVSWSSSNEAVATVAADGTVTAQSFGGTVITAALANGSTAQAVITVAPPLTSLAFERSVYKVKPGNFRFPKLVPSPAGYGEEIIWTSSDPSIASVSENGTISGIAYGTVTITATGKYSGLSASCEVTVCDVRQVAITFDDGPGSNTAWLLDYLKTRNIPVTFFLLGDLISHYPDAVVRQASEGHEIGYHSYKHDNQLRLTSEKIISDFNASNELLKSLTGQEFTLWRSPGGNYDQRVLDCIPLPHIYWSVDTRDWESRNADAIYSQIINNTGDGSIVLLHDIYGSTIEGAIRGIDALIAAGYELLTVTELLSRDGTPPENCVNYYND